LEEAEDETNNNAMRK